MNTPANDTVHVIFNDSDEIKSIPLDRINEKAFTTVLSQGFVPVVVNNNLYLHHFPDIPETFKSKAFYEQPIEVVYDLHSGEYRTLPNARYPEVYHQYSFGYVFSPYRNVFDDKMLVYTFPNDASAYVLNIEDDLLNSHDFGIRTEYAQQGVDISKAVFTDKKVYEEMFKGNAFYFFPKYAPLSGFYLRTMLVPQESSQVTRPVVYSVYNSDFTYVGESKPMENGLGIIMDSKDGLMSLEFENDTLFVYDVSWIMQDQK